MHWRLFGRLPLLHVTGPDVTRSALGAPRGGLCFVPAAAVSPSVTWQALDDRRVIACVDSGGRLDRVTLTVGPCGALERVDMSRWGRPTGASYRRHLFNALMDGGEVTFDGFTIPAHCRAGWWHCPDGCASEEFIRFSIDDALFR